MKQFYLSNANTMHLCPLGVGHIWYLSVRYIPFWFQKVHVRFQMTTLVLVMFSKWACPVQYQSFSVPGPIWY